QAAGGPRGPSFSGTGGTDGERALDWVGRWGAKTVAGLLDQVFDHPHRQAARLVIHLVAELIDEQPDHVQSNGFIVELRPVAGAANGLLLHGARRDAAHFDLEAPGPALEDQLELSVAPPPLLGGGGAGTLAGLCDGDVQVVDFLHREADDEAQGGGGPLGDDDVVGDGRELQFRDVRDAGRRLVASCRGLVAKSVFPHASSRCWPAGDLRRRPIPPRASRTRSRQPVIAAPVAFIARSAAVNLSLTPLTMSSICCRLCRSSGSANRASSSVRVRMASIVRRLRVMFRRMKEAKMLSRRNPMPTSSTPTCHTITNSSRAPHSRDIADVVPHSGSRQTYPAAGYAGWARRTHLLTAHCRTPKPTRSLTGCSPPRASGAPTPASPEASPRSTASALSPRRTR